MTSTKHTSMNRMPRLMLSIAVVLAVLTGGAGVLSATAQGENTIYACSHKSSGILRIVGGPNDCNSTENTLSWSTGGTAAAVHWDDIDGIPPHVENRVAKDVQCDGCVSTIDIEDFSVQADDLGPGSVTNAKLANESVSASTLAWNSVNGYVHVQDGTITTDDLANNSITEGKLAPGSVRGGQDGVIADGSITADDLAENSVGALEIQSGAVGTHELANNSVTGDKIVDSSITGNHVADGSITGTDIEDGSITSQDIDANAASGTFANLVINDLESPGHRVLISADAKVTCPVDSSAAGCIGTVEWQIKDGATPVGTLRSLRIALIPGEEIQITAQDITFASHGEHVYTLSHTYFPTGDSNLELTQYVVIAVDLGR